MDGYSVTDIELDHISNKHTGIYNVHNINTKFLANRLSLIVSLDVNDTTRNSSHNKLLQVLAGKLHYTGNVKFNDICVDTTSYSEKIGYISESDYSYRTITPYEKLLLACSLRYHNLKSKKDQHALVKYIILKLKINDHDKYHGTLISRSYSALNEKLIELGVRLIYNYDIILLENPTLYMNVYETSYFLNTIKRILDNKTIVISMDLVNNQILQQFDDVTIISKSHVVYSGKVNFVSTYLYDIGCPCKSEDDIIQYFMYIVQNPHIKILFDETWKTSTINNNVYAYKTLVNYYQQMYEFRQPVESQKFVCNEMLHLQCREIKHVCRNDRLWIFELGVILVCNILLGVTFQNTVYWNNNYNIEYWSESRFSIINTVLITNTLLLTYFSINTYRYDFMLYKQEKYMYSAVRYIISKTFTEIIKVFLYVSIILGINFGLIGLYGKFLNLLVEFSTIILSVTTFVMLTCSILSYGEHIAFCVYFLPQCLLCGLVIPVSDIYQYVQPVYYMCLLNYGVNIMSVEEMTVLPQTLTQNNIDILFETTYGCLPSNATNYTCDTIINDYAIFPRNHIRVENQIIYIQILGIFTLIGRIFTCIAINCKK